MTLFVQAIAQKGFYLRPAIECDWNSNRNQSYIVPSPQGGIPIKSAQLFTMSGFDNIRFYLGYRINNYFFETGYLENDIGFSIKEYGSYLYWGNINANRNHEDPSSITAAGSFYRIPVRMGKKLWGKDFIQTSRKWYWQGFVFGGIDYLYDRNYKQELAEMQHPAPFATAPIIDSVTFPHTFLGSLGFMLKTYNKKGHNMLTISIDFSQTLTNYQLETHIETIAVNGQTNTHFITNRGSGLHICIGWDLFPKNWKRKKVISNPTPKTINPNW